MAPWRYLFPQWVVDMAGGIKPLRESFERQAGEGTLPPGCVGFEITGELGVAESHRDVYTCHRFRRDSDILV